MTDNSEKEESDYERMARLIMNSKRPETLEQVIKQRDALHEQLLEHAEVCGESAYPLSQRLAKGYYERELAELREYLRERLGNDYARLVEDIERNAPTGTERPVSEPPRFTPNGRFVMDDDFGYDAKLKVDGDWPDDSHRDAYVKAVCDGLNAATIPTLENDLESRVASPRKPKRRD